MGKEAAHLVTSDAYSAVGVSFADIKRMGHEMWGGNDGNVGSDEGSNSSLPIAGKPIPIHQGMQDAFDEVSPTQSDPPDSRSDNLLTGPGAMMAEDSSGGEAHPDDPAEQAGEIAAYSGGMESRDESSKEEEKEKEHEE